MFWLGGKCRGLSLSANSIPATRSSISGTGRGPISLCVEKLRGRAAQISGQRFSVSAQRGKHKMQQAQRQPHGPRMMAAVQAGGIHVARGAALNVSSVVSQLPLRLLFAELVRRHAMNVSRLSCS